MNFQGMDTMKGTDRGSCWACGRPTVWKHLDAYEEPPKWEYECLDCLVKRGQMEAADLEKG